LHLGAALCSTAVAKVSEEVSEDAVELFLLTFWRMQATRTVAAASIFVSSEAATRVLGKCEIEKKTQIRIEKILRERASDSLRKHLRLATHGCLAMVRETWSTAMN
jgi:hypothetical protein